MSSLFDLPTSIFGYGIGGIVAALIIIKWSQHSKLDAIPTAGSSSRLGSWWAGWKYLTNALGVLQEGYEKYNPEPFKVAEPHRWLVVVNSRQHIEELRTAPDDALSILEAVNDQLHVEYTMGAQIHHNPYHVPIIRSQLTRNIGVLYPGIRDEIITAFHDVLDLRGNEWRSVSAFSAVQNIICRISNRLFVGLPLCRDPDWIDLSLRYTLDVVKAGIIIGMFPDSLKSMATWLFTNIEQCNRSGRKLLGPIIEERRKCLNEYGNEWAEKPNDFLSWLMEEATGSESSISYLTSRILVVNFAALHTTSMSFTHALFYLAANPQYIQPLREEVEDIIEKEGWSKTAIGKMRKIDSFFKECQRLEGVGALSMSRKALKDFTFSGGLFIPKGTVVATVARCIHRDEAFYRNANTFEPFRFSELREEDGEEVKHHFASTTTDYLAFGHGRHACPGRFLAANELKSMLAHLVVTYDIKLAGNATRPATISYGSALVPDPKAEVMFRRRVD